MSVVLLWAVLIILGARPLLCITVAAILLESPVMTSLPSDCFTASTIGKAPTSSHFGFILSKKVGISFHQRHSIGCEIYETDDDQI
jgi:hypothetical protein